MCSRVSRFASFVFSSLGLNPRRVGGAIVSTLFLTVTPPALCASDPLPNFDIRNDDAVVRSEIEQSSAGQRQRRIDGVRQLQMTMPDIRVSAHGLWETATSVRSTSRLLTPPVQGAFESIEIVGAFVDAHTPLFGIARNDIQTAKVKRDAITRHNGVQTIWWQQQINNIDVDGCQLRANVTSRGELISIGSTMLGEPEQGFNIGEATLDATHAIAAAGRVFGEALDATTLEPIRIEDSGYTRFDRIPGVLDEPLVKLVYFPLTQRELHPAFKIILTPASMNASYEVWIDATDGALLRLDGMTHSGGSETATFRVWASDSPSPMSPGTPTPDGTQPPVTTPDLVTLIADDPVASPTGWIPDGDNVVAGNNALAYSDMNGDNFPDAALLAGSPYRVFDHSADFASEPAAYVNASIANAFFMTNRFHDRAYALGFTEEFGNFQSDNFGRGGAGGDQVVIEVQDGDGTNNASFSTSGDDGVFGRATFELFDGPTPDRDSSLDNEVLLHELTHGLSIRLHGGLIGEQPEGMGEGWSDFIALSMLAEPADDHHASYGIGAYVGFDAIGSGFDDNYYFGIRRFPYSTDLTKNPLTYADINGAQFHVDPSIPIGDVIPSDNPGTVHNMGELWCSALWECRAALIDNYGFAGNELMLQLVIDGMKLTPDPFPNMLESRDMILLADQINNGGANVCDLWAAFAKRGLGFSAVSNGITTNNIVEAFDIPDSLGIFAAAPLPSSAPYEATTPVSIDVVERVCGDPFVPGTATLWLSVNDGPFNAIPMSTEGGLQFGATLPALGCGEFAKYYFTADTAVETFAWPEDAPASFFSYPVVTPQTARVDQIAPSDLEIADQFGYRLAVHGDRLAVTNLEDDAEGPDVGSVYVFRRDGDDWVIETELFASDPSSPWRFGHEIDMDADRLVVAAWDADEFGDPATGPVYIFKRDGTSWSFEQRLVPPDPAGGRFGWALAIDGDKLLVGAPAIAGDQPFEGAVYFYEHDGVEWSLQQEIRSPNAEFEERFGSAIDMEGDVSVVGEISISNLVLFDPGSVYEYAFDGSQWQLVTEIVPSDALQAEFGQSVDLNGEFLAVGGPDEGKIDSGAAWVFRRDGQGGWIEEGKLTPEIPQPGSLFATQVAMGDGVVAVGGYRHDQFGSNTGVVAIYRRIGGQWFREQTLAPPDPGFANGLGVDVQILDDVGYFGAYRQNTPLNNAGSVHEYELAGVDCNMNGMIDGCEIQAGLATDGDGDGIIDACEVPEILGDLNGDGIVNGADLASLLAQWGTSGEADLNMDGVVNGADLATLLANWSG